MISQDPSILLAWLTLASHVGIVIFLILALFFRKTVFFSNILSVLQRHAILFSLIVAASGTLLSLYYSEVLRFEPCRFCWFQRILLYPQVILFGVALWHKRSDVFQYIVPLCLIGLAIAGYHYSLQMSHVLNPAQVPDSCSLTGPSCMNTELLEFGYITIPLMSATSFALILLFAWSLRLSLRPLEATK